MTEDSLPEQARPGGKDGGAAEPAAGVTCGPEWEGEPGRGSWGGGRGRRGRGLRRGGGLGAGPGDPGEGAWAVRAEGGGVRPVRTVQMGRFWRDRKLEILKGWVR